MAIPCPLERNSTWSIIQAIQLLHVIKVTKPMSKMADQRVCLPFVRHPSAYPIPQNCIEPDLYPLKTGTGLFVIKHSLYWDYHFVKG